MTAVGKDGRALGVPAAPAPSFRELFVMHRAPNDPRLTASRIMSALKLTKVQGHRGARATSTPTRSASSAKSYCATCGSSAAPSNTPSSRLCPLHPPQTPPEHPENQPMHVRHHLTRRGFTGRVLTITAAIAAEGAATSLHTVAVYSRSLSAVPGAGVLRSMPVDPEAAAHELFAVLRELDAAGVAEIWVEHPPADVAWEAVTDRLRRAAA